MRHLRRTLIVLLTLTLVITMLPVSVSAAVKKPGKPKITMVTVSQRKVTVKYNKVKNAKTYKLYRVTYKTQWKYLKKIKASQKKKYSNKSKYKLKKDGKKYKVYQKKSVKKYKLLKTSKKLKISFTGNWNTTYNLAVRAFNGKKAGSYSAVKKAKIGKAPSPDYDSYETYVFFGSDSRANDESWKSPNGGKITADSSGTEGTPRSDVIMLLQVNRTDKTIDIVSIYRDTAMDRSTEGDPNFQKANKAYAADGPKAAIAVLEKNLDIKIKGYASSNFKGVADVIDDLCSLTGSKGIEISGLTEETVEAGKEKGLNDVVDTVNYYISEMNSVYGTQVAMLKDHTNDKQMMNGLQAVGFARTRYTEGWEMRRTGRQREVLLQMIEKYKKLDADKKIRLITGNASAIETDLGLDELAKLISAVCEYKIVTSAYPYYKGQVVKTTDEEDFNTSTMIVPVSIEENVKKLHTSTYGESWYVPNSVIKDLSSKLINEIEKKTDIYHDYTGGRVKDWDKY